MDYLKAPIVMTSTYISQGKTTTDVIGDIKDRDKLETGTGLIHYL